MMFKPVYPRVRILLCTWCMWQCQ